MAAAYRRHRGPLNAPPWPRSPDSKVALPIFPSRVSEFWYLLFFLRRGGARGREGGELLFSPLFFFLLLVLCFFSLVGNFSFLLSIVLLFFFFRPTISCGFPASVFPLPFPFFFFIIHLEGLNSSFSLLTLFSIFQFVVCFIFPVDVFSFFF